jgi:hypothetical protein
MKKIIFQLFTQLFTGLINLSLFYRTKFAEKIIIIQVTYSDNLNLFENLLFNYDRDRDINTKIVLLT